jgi:hypothetical protein
MSAVGVGEREDVDILKLKVHRALSIPVLIHTTFGHAMQIQKHIVV